MRDGFIPHTVDGGHVPALELLPCGAITPQVGMALVQSSGLLAIAAGAVAPDYISMCRRDAACTEGERIPVIRVTPGICFRTTCSEELTDIVPGDRVTLHATSGMQVTAVTTGGVATVEELEGTDSGSAVYVRFR